MRTRTIRDVDARWNSAALLAQAMLVGSIVLAISAALMWLVSLQKVDIRQITDIGLVGLLPPAALTALAILTASFCLSLHRRPLSAPLLLLHLGALIFMLFGATTIVEELPRFEPAWRHVGVIEYILRMNQIDPKIDAYFNWPGFFIFGALVTRAAGYRSAIDLLSWAPVFFNLLYLGPLLMIMKAATTDRRVIWLSLWFFYVTNWIGQDYFSPQALNYFLFLVVLAILLTWFKVTTPAPSALDQRLQRFGRVSRWMNWVYEKLTPVDPIHTSCQPWQRGALMAVLIVVFFVIAASHQITPFFAIGAVTALVILNRVMPRGLPVVMVVLVGGWIRFMAVRYFSGHVGAMTEHVGQVSDTVNANLTSRLLGSPGHLFVVYMRLVMTVAIWGLAFFGGLRRLRKGYWDLSFVILMMVPFPFLVLQTYGGELLLRAYLFALPPAAFFAATLFYPSPSSGRSWKTSAAIGLASVALLGGFLFTRYGNEKTDYFTRNEVEAIQHLYEIAKPGSLIIAGTHSLPWKFQDYEKYRYQRAEEAILTANMDEIEQLMASRKRTTAYLILTRSQKANAELFSGLPPAKWKQFEEQLRDSGRFQLIYANQDASIFTLAPGRHR